MVGHHLLLHLHLHAPVLWAGSLTGTLQDAESGAPLIGAAVYAYDLRLEGSAVLTDASGAFRLSDLPAGRYRLLARPDDTDNNLSRFYPDRTDFCDSPLLSLGDGESRSGLDMALPVGGELSGALQDSAGVPLAGVTVVARTVPGTATEGAFERLTATDAQGLFRLRGLDGPGEWAIELQGETIPTQYLGESYTREGALLLEAVPGALRDGGEHRVLPGITVLGGVYGPDDPAADASVIVYSGGQVRTVKTDGEGHYLAQGMAPGEVVTWSEPLGLALTYLPDHDRPTESISATEEGTVLEGVDLFPPLPASLTVTVADARTGDPIPGASVTLYNDNQSVAKGEPAPEGVATIAGLHGGDYFLYVFAADEGFTNGWILDEQGEKTVFSVLPEQDAAVEVLLSPAARIQGTVRDEDGAPVYGATVYAYDALGGTSAETAADGTFVLDGLSGGAWWLQVDVDIYCLADPGWVPVYWPGVVYSEDREGLDLAAGEVRAVSLVMPRDDDHDGMGDGWERRGGLAVGRDDSQEDPDGDGLTNIWEYWLGTDPQEADAGSRVCGCGRDGIDSGGAGGLLLPGVLLGWQQRRRGRRRGLTREPG